MSEEIKSIRIISNNMNYGSKPDANDEVEQYLTVSSTGRVWFSARNYQQYQNNDGFCRKKQVSIGKWKAGFLLTLIRNMQFKPESVADVGNYRIEVSLSNGRKEKIQGNLKGDVLSHAYGHEADVDLTRLVRRYIPIYGLWVFDASIFPDYEGKKAIYLFAESWKKFFEKPNSNITFEEEFGRECQQLGFQMDSGERFISECKKLGCKIPYGVGMKEAVAKIDDIEVIGSGTFSYWRVLTHWDYMYHLGPEECGNFLCLLRRLKELTRKK